jgi:hypothetical protein
MRKNKAIFTSINSYYLSKAIALGKTVLNFHPEVDFIILMNENPLTYDFIKLQNFLDEFKIKVLAVNDIKIKNVEQFLFQRQIVEACTAVKGRALCYLLDKYEKVIYLDPDICLFDNITKIWNQLDVSDVILIPHQNRPSEASLQFGVEAELTSLQYGVFNLGFCAVKDNKNGREFANWWAERLYVYCFDDRSKGLFTDQKWCDLAPALFENVYIEREPGFNVAPWNSHCYQLEIKYGATNITINGTDTTLKFFHFSGFDSGEGLKASSQMKDYGKIHKELYLWYLDFINKIGENCKEYVKNWTYGLFNDGSSITKNHRFISKKLIESKIDISNPYSAAGKFYLDAYLEKIKKK